MFYVADTEGYYEEAGIKVEFVYTGEGAGSVMKQLGANNVEFGYGGSSGVITSVKAEVPTLAILKVIQANLFRIVVRPESGIESPTDLRGKTIAFSGPQGTVTMVARIILQESGVGWEEIEPRYVGAQMVSSFVVGQADAMGVYLPQQVIAESLLSQELVAFEGKDYTPLGTTYLYTSQALASQNPELVYRFTNATQRGSRKAIAQPELAVDAFLQLVPEAADRRDLHLAIWQAMAAEGFERGKDGEVIFGLPSEDGWETKIEQMVASGILEEAIDIAGYISDAFATQALNREQ